MSQKEALTSPDDITLLKQCIHEYELLLTIISSSCDLPLDLNTSLSTWRNQCTFIPHYNLIKSTSKSSTNSTKSSGSPHIASSTAVVSKQKQSQLLSKIVKDPIVEELNDIMHSIYINNDILLPTVSHLNNKSLVSCEEDNSKIPITSFSWDKAFVNKSRCSKTLWTYTFSFLSRAANIHLKSSEAQQSDAANDISPSELAHAWVDVLLPYLEQALKRKLEESLHMEQTSNLKPKVSSDIWKQMTVQKALTKPRMGTFDFCYVPVSTSEIKSSSENKQEHREEIAVTKRKATNQDVSTSPLIKSPSSSAPNAALTSDVIQLSPPPLIENLIGLFDFTPTTGESRHCINPFTSGMQQFKFDAIGYINSCFRSKFSTPRQGNAVPTSHASLTLHRDVSIDSVHGLDDYSHIWVFFVFHSNVQSKYKPKVIPPRLGERVGCLATRTPHRPNDIGLSLVKLDRLERPADFSHLPLDHPSRDFTVYTPGILSKAQHLPGCVRLILSNVDLIDGTPILDIKPFNPGDIIPNPQKNLRLPQWLATAPLYTLQIQFHKQAELDLLLIFEKYYSEMYKNVCNKSNNKESTDVIDHDGIKANISTITHIYNNNKNNNSVVHHNLQENHSVPTVQSIIDPLVDNQFSNDLPSVIPTPSSQFYNASHIVYEDWKTLTEAQLFLSKLFGSPLQFYQTSYDLQKALIHTLQNDPRPIVNKQKNIYERNIYGFLFDNLNIVYQMTSQKSAQICLLQHRNEYLGLPLYSKRYLRHGENLSTVKKHHIDNSDQRQQWAENISRKLAETITPSIDNRFTTVSSTDNA